MTDAWGDSDESIHLSKNEVFELLAARRRRDVLVILSRIDGETTLGGLAERIAAKESETDIEDITTKQRKRVYVSLYQTHIPKLEESGVIKVNDSDSTIELTDRASLVLPYLSIDPTREKPLTAQINSALDRLFSS